MLRKALWAQVLRRKYCNWRRMTSNNANKLPCSPIWIAMKKGLDTFNKGSKWVVGKDCNLKVWYSNWIDKGPFKQLIQGPLTQKANQLEIKDFILDSNWDWDRLSFDLPLEIRRMIQATPITITSRGSDKLAWAGSPQGTFDFKSAYKITSGQDCNTPFSASWVWKVDTLPHIKTFLWMCAHNRIGVKVCLVKRGIVEEESFPICRKEPESIIHALQDCPRIKTVWV